MRPGCVLALLGVLLVAVLGASGCNPDVETAQLLRRADHAMAAGKKREAKRDYEAYLDASRALGVTRDVDAEIEAHRRLGAMAEEEGGYSAAMRHYRDALPAAIALHRNGAIAQLAVRIGELESLRGNYETAQGLLERAGSIPWASAPDAFRAGLQRALAVVRAALGDYQGSKVAADAARRLYKRSRDDAGLAALAVVDAGNDQAVGDFQAGLAAVRDGEARAAKAKLPAAAIAALHLARSGLLQSVGDFAQALLSDQKALDLVKSGPTTKTLGAAYGSLGADYFVLGETARARENIERALSIHRAVEARDEEARSLLNLGRLDLADRDRDAATERLNRALELFGQSGQRVGQALVLSALGEVREAQGDRRGAVEAHTKAAAIYREAGEANGVALESVAVGRLQLALGDPARSLATLEEAGRTVADPEIGWRVAHGKGRALVGLGRLDPGERELASAVRTLELLRQQIKVRELKTAFNASEERSRVYEDLVLLLLKRGRKEEAFAMAERAKARAFLDQLGSRQIDWRRGARPELVGEERRLTEQIQIVRARLAAQAGPAADHSADVASLGKLEASYAELMNRIAIESPERGALVSANPQALASVQSAVPEDATLVDYYLARDQLLAFLITRHRLDLVRQAVGIEGLYGAIRAYRIEVQQRRDETALALFLQGTLVAPLRPYLSGHRLIVIPHGLLHYVPFAALRMPDGRRLVDIDTISYAPSASVYVLGRAKRTPRRSTLLALGDPAQPDAGYPPLPAAREEVAAIARFYSSSRILVGSQATLEEFRRLAPEAGVVHLACHGELDALFPNRSAMLLAPSGGRDGRLEVGEIYGLSLGASLVVLSACETGLGSLSRGDELVGLSRAFLNAGTPSVVASLWSVADRSTGDLMVELHRRLGQSPKDEALRGAQLWLKGRKATAHPFFWAPFELIGER